ncbi:MAG: hypothetical protein ACK5PF_00300, partial [bacterium]
HSPLRTLTGWGYQDCPDLKLSNRPVRTRMPGGVAGVPPTMEAPFADWTDLPATRFLQETRP